jgi:peroxiredoxin
MAAGHLRFERALRAAIDLDAPLEKRLAVITHAIRGLDTPFAEAVERLVGRLRRQGAGTTAPAPGEIMPAFLLPDENGHLVSLPALIQTGPAAIMFQRGHWCPFCRMNAIAVAGVQQQIAAIGAHVVAIVPQRREYTAALKRDVGADHSFLTDMDNGYALSLNLAIWIGMEMQQLFGEGALDLPGYQANAACFLPIPATFIVGTDGVIVARHVDPDYRKRMAIEDLLAALERAR